MQVLLSEIEPGGGSGVESYGLPVDVEFVFVLDGALRITFASDGSGTAPDAAGAAAPAVGVVGGASAVVLTAGDAFTFSPRRRHSFHAVGEAATRVLWVLAPALPEGGRRETAADI